MTWSFKLVRLLGVDVKVHFTFLLVLLFIGLDGYRTGGVAAAAQTVGLTLSVFGCVVLHEYGHILTARQFGIRTRDVVLLPIGGLARLERLPERPREEFLIAVAGPAVNLAIAFVVGGALALVADLALPKGVPLQLTPGRFVFTFVALIVAAVLGSAISLRRVTRIDPASAIGSAS